MPFLKKSKNYPHKVEEKKEEKMQRNKNSKYQPDKPAFAGKTPFAKRMRRALGEDSPVQTSTKNEKTTKSRSFNIFLVAIVISIAVLLSYNYTDEFNTQSSVESELATKNVVLYVEIMFEYLFTGILNSNTQVRCIVRHR